MKMASARESLRAKSDSFQHRKFVNIKISMITFCHVCTFTGIVVDVASALACEVASSTLAYFLEENLHNKRQLRWRRPQLRGKFLLWAHVFSHKYLLDISHVQCAQNFDLVKNQFNSFQARCGNISYLSDMPGPRKGPHSLQFSSIRGHTYTNCTKNEK